MNYTCENVLVKPTMWQLTHTIFFICLILFDFDGIGTTYRTCQGIHCVPYVAF